jgi:hypothetical protein
VWSHLKRGLGNLAACGTDELAAIVRNRLKSMQYRPSHLDAVSPKQASRSSPDRHDHFDLSVSGSAEPRSVAPSIWMARGWYTDGGPVG